MKKLNASEFKARCLKLLENLDQDGLIITKHGQPIAKVIPFEPSSIKEFYGCMKDKIKVKGDIFTTGVKWNAQS